MCRKRFAYAHVTHARQQQQQHGGGCPLVKPAPTQYGHCTVSTQMGKEHTLAPVPHVYQLRAYHVCSTGCTTYNSSSRMVPHNHPMLSCSAIKCYVYTVLQGTQDLLQRMCADLFQERPTDAVAYMMQWLEAEKARREEKQQQAVNAANQP